MELGEVEGAMASIAVVVVGVITVVVVPIFVRMLAI
jgi:holin-like protein LrgB